MANEVATTQAKPEIVKFSEQLEQRAAQIKMALPAHITPEKFQRTLITAAQQNPTLLEADRQSLVLACMKAAQDGLVPDGREAALVIFSESKKQPDGSWQKRKLVQYMPMVYGLRKKILQSGEVAALEVGVVYAAEVEAGKFLYEVGIEPPLRHRPMLELNEEQTTDAQIVAAYSIATMKDGTRSYELMRRFEINKVRQMSQTGAEGQVGKFGEMRGKAIAPKGPWVDWFPEMAKKTVVRRHTKSLPMSGDLIVDVEGRELDSAQSAAALLSHEPDAPQIEHRDEDPAHDAVTGELVDDRQPTTNAVDDREPEPAKRTRRTKAQIAADEAAEREAEAAADAEAARLRDEGNADSGNPSDDAKAGDESEASDETSTGNPVDPAADDSSLDDGRHPAQDKADAIMASFKAATLVTDLNRLRNESTVDVMAMPDELAEAVDNAYRANLKRLQGK